MKATWELKGLETSRLLTPALWHCVLLFVLIDSGAGNVLYTAVVFRVFSSVGVTDLTHADAYDPFLGYVAQLTCRSCQGDSTSY